MSYIIRYTPVPPPLDAQWDHPVWEQASIASVENFHARSSPHRPQTRVRLLYDADYLYVMFHVQDQFVRCVYTEHQSPVCRDSCVEFFFSTRPGRGYFNIEVNCGGWVLFHHQYQPRSSDTTEMAPQWIEQMQVHHTMPNKVDPEVKEPTTWTVAYRIPFAALSDKLQEPVRFEQGLWQGNFYKCGDETSHPHWASWQPVKPVLDFHVPECFSPLIFETTLADAQV